VRPILPLSLRALAWLVLIAGGAAVCFLTFLVVMTFLFNIFIEPPVSKQRLAGYARHTSRENFTNGLRMMGRERQPVVMVGKQPSEALVALAQIAIVEIRKRLRIISESSAKRCACRH
jgi:hypothetical protein